MARYRRTNYYSRPDYYYRSARRAVPAKPDGRKQFSARETNEYAIIKYVMLSGILLLLWFFIALSVHLRVDDNDSGKMSANAQWITIALCIVATIMVFALDMAFGYKLVPLFFK